MITWVYPCLDVVVNVNGDIVMFMDLIDCWSHQA